MKLPSISENIQHEGMAGLSLQHRIELNNFVRGNVGMVYKLHALPADCSKRQYYRVLHYDGSHILMDSSLDPSIRDFIGVQAMLSEYGISVPSITSQDLLHGFLLLQDLGDTTLTKHLQQHPEDEVHFYDLCTEILLSLLRSPAPSNLPTYNWDLLVKELMIFERWYLKPKLSSEVYQYATGEMYEIFYNWYSDYLLQLPRVITLRDFMADNIMVKERVPIVLDFQDAVLGNPVYDLVSLLQDARRDVTHAVATRCQEHFITTSGINATLARQCYHILGLQRNLKIVGIFNMRHMQDGKEHYLSYLPRVWSHIKSSLEDKIAHPLKKWFIRYDLL
jgi:aminoglycoside/choline kinase family phosphotransferase